MCERQSDNSFVNLLNGVVSGQPSYGRYSVSTASAASSLHPAARDHGTSSARADQSFGSGWRAEARAKVQSSRVFSHQFAKPVVKSNGYFYGSPKKNAGYGGHHAPYFNKGNRPTTSNNPTFNNRSNWNRTYSNNQATSFGHESGWNGRSHGYHGGASVTHTFRNRSMTGMEFVHGKGNVQSMNFTVFQHMNSNSSEQQATSSGYSNVHQPGHVLNGDNYEHGRNKTRLTVSQLFGRPEETEVPIDQLRPQQDDLEGLTEQFDQLVHQQSAGCSTTPPFDHSDPRVGTSGGTFEDDGQETHIGMGTPLMRLSAFEREMSRRNSAASSPDGNSIQSRKSSPVTADNDVKSDVGVSSSGHTLQPSEQRVSDAPSTSGQEGKRRRRRNRSKKSSKINKPFDADVTIGNRYDDSQMFNGLDETIADKPTGGFTVSQSTSSNENTPLGFSTRPSKFDQLQSSVKRGIHPMMIPEFKGQRTDKASAASSSNGQWDKSPRDREDELSCFGILTNLPLLPLSQILKKLSVQDLLNLSSVNESIGNFIQNIPIRSGGFDICLDERGCVVQMLKQDFIFQRYDKNSAVVMESFLDFFNVCKTAFPDQINKLDVCPLTFSEMIHSLPKECNVLSIGREADCYSEYDLEYMDTCSHTTLDALLDQVNFKKGLALNGPFELPTENKKVFKIDWLRVNNSSWMDILTVQRLQNKVIHLLDSTLTDEDANTLLHKFMQGTGNNKLKVMTIQKEGGWSMENVMKGLHVEKVKKQTFQINKKLVDCSFEYSDSWYEDGVTLRDAFNITRPDGTVFSVDSIMTTLRIHVWPSKSGKAVSGERGSSISAEPTEGFTVFQNMDSQFKGSTNTRKSTSPILNLTMDDAPAAFDVTIPEPNLNQTFSGILKVGKKNIRPKSVVFGKFPTPLARSETFAELHPPRSPSVRAGWKNSAKLINLEAIEVELYDEYVGIYKALTCTDKMRQMPEIVVDKDTIYYCIEGTDELLELPPTFEFNLYPVEELPSGIVMAGRYKYMFDDENDALGKLLKTVCKALMRTQWTQSNLPEIMLKNRVTRIAPVKVLPTVDDCLVPDEELSASDRCLRKFFLKKYRNEPASPGTDIPDEVVDPFSPIDLTKGRKIAEMEGMPHQRNGFWHMKEASPKEISPVEDQNDVSRPSKLPIMLPKRVKVGRAEYALPRPRVGDLHTFSPECIANNAPSSEPTCSNVPLGDMLSTPTKLASPSMFNPLASSTPRKDSDSEMNGGVVRRLRDPMDDIPSTSGSAAQSSSRMNETPKMRKPKDRKPKDHWMCKDGLEDPPSSD